MKLSAARLIVKKVKDFARLIFESRIAQKLWAEYQNLKYTKQLYNMA
jgi:hypothetical protein